MTAAPDPHHIIRTHHAPIAALRFDPTNAKLYAGDQDGFISIIDLKARRPLSHWKAHEGGVLGVNEVNACLISQGRDNKLHLYDTHVGNLFTSGPGPSHPPPSIAASLDINALNFCRFSMCSIPRSSLRMSSAKKGKGKAFDDDVAVLALPNLVDSELADIYLLPSMSRLHAAFNMPPQHADKSIKPAKTIIPASTRSGLIMAIHIAYNEAEKLRVVLAYEDGRVEMWKLADDEKDWRQASDARLNEADDRAWIKVREFKGHNEAVMAMTVNSTLSRAYTVSADHQLCRYDLSAESEDGCIKKQNTGQIGNASIAISADDKVVAVGGWDGKIRLFSAASLKPLGTLAFHRETVHTLAFANCVPVTNDTIAPGDTASTLDLEAEDSDEEEETREQLLRGRYLASGGKDTRIALWLLKDFAVT
ncbi:WD40-repeat-containing domain protein [Kockovaella imperatae]|uniref:ASTRA-associated protein 1 n=1 Tax=Kockovaella imperatae TaxID=4999 RepID=A0A1Y1UHR5_9TREE|nr:WD40-repeat-containing domain protein [Kockovaella imperatae]ORX37077.1 WD40-repeat-containing domain protein [Kockovaella imperatae]